MTVWAISDLHLAFSVPSKTMEAFGPQWVGYTDKIASAWKEVISNDDLVLIPGDISWAMHLEEALIDFHWIEQLPGKKLMIKGNHDYWWGSASKLRKALPPSIEFIYNSAFLWKDITIGGTRLWDTAEYQFNEYILFQENPLGKKASDSPSSAILAENEKIFSRELERLKYSLQMLDPFAKIRIALTHYPPIGADLAPSKTAAILEAFHIDHCVFGHLHSVKPNSLPFGAARGVDYHFTSCDYLDFKPVKIL